MTQTKTISGDIESVVRELFSGNPPPEGRYQLLPEDANGDLGLVFEILITVLLEALVFLNDGTLDLESSGTDLLDKVFNQLKPYFESIKYKLIVESKTLLCDANDTVINMLSPYRYCKVLIASMNREYFREKKLNKEYTFLLNPAPIERVRLDEYYALFVIGHKAYKLRFESNY